MGITIAKRESAWCGRVMSELLQRSDSRESRFLCDRFVGEDIDRGIFTRRDSLPTSYEIE